MQKKKKRKKLKIHLFLTAEPQYFSESQGLHTYVYYMQMTINLIDDYPLEHMATKYSLQVESQKRQGGEIS